MESPQYGGLQLYANSAIILPNNFTYIVTGVGGIFTQFSSSFKGLEQILHFLKIGSALSAVTDSITSTATHPFDSAMLTVLPSFTVFFFLALLCPNLLKSQQPL